MPLILLLPLPLLLLFAGGCRTPTPPVRIGDPAAAGLAAPVAPSGRETRVELALSNGLRVVLEENHISPVVAMQAWVGVGSADDPPEMAGAAHLFEHMLFKSTKRRGPGQIAREIDALGGTIKAWTSFDQTTYQLVLASAYVDYGLDLLADALTNATFDPGELERERKVVQVELKQAEESPERTASQALFRAAFSVHPYGRPVLGTDAAVAAITREQLLALYQRTYGGRNLTLLVVGDFDAAALKDKIKNVFAPLRRGDAPPARRAEPLQAAPRTVVLARDLRETQLLLGFHTPPVTDDDIPALDLLSAILGQGDGSRLSQRLVRSRQLLSKATSYNFVSRDAGLLVVGATMAPGRLEEPARALLDEVLRLSYEEVSPGEIDAARTLLTAGVVRDQETPAGYARKLGFFAAVAGDVAREEVYRTRMAALTPADLRVAAARYLRTATLASAALVSARGITGGRGAVDPVKLGARLDTVWAAGEARVARRFAPLPIAPTGDDLVRVVLPSGAAPAGAARSQRQRGRRAGGLARRAALRRRALERHLESDRDAASARHQDPRRLAAGRRARRDAWRAIRLRRPQQSGPRRGVRGQRVGARARDPRRLHPQSAVLGGRARARAPRGAGADPRPGSQPGRRRVSALLVDALEPASLSPA